MKWSHYVVTGAPSAPGEIFTDQNAAEHRAEELSTTTTKWFSGEPDVFVLGAPDRDTAELLAFRSADREVHFGVVRRINSRHPVPAEVAS